MRQTVNAPGMYDAQNPIPVNGALIGVRPCPGIPPVSPLFVKD